MHRSGASRPRTPRPARLASGDDLARVPVDRRRCGRSSRSRRRSRSRPTSSRCRARAIGHGPSTGDRRPRVAIGFAPRAVEALGVTARPLTRVTGLVRDGAARCRRRHRARGGPRAGGGRRRGRVGIAVAGAAGLGIPLVPGRHQLFVTEPIAGVEPLQPIVRAPRGERLRPLRPRRPDVRRLRGSTARPSTRPRSRRPSRSPTWRSTSACCAALLDEVVEHFPVLRAAAVAVHRGGLPTMTARRVAAARPGGRPRRVPRRLRLLRGWPHALARRRPRPGATDPRRQERARSGSALARRFRGRYEGRAEICTAAAVDRYARKYVK